MAETKWGIDNDYAWLIDVLLGWLEYFRWVEAGPLIGRTLANAHMTSAANLNAQMRAMGFEVYDPDMSMLTLGGGGVHCLCQALRREAA